MAFLKVDYCGAPIFASNVSQNGIELGETNIIGRDGATVDVVSLSRRVSRLHCLIRKGKDAYYIRDLESTNGTILNEDECRSEMKLENGDEIWLASAACLRLQFFETSCEKEEEEVVMLEEASDT